MTRIAACTLMTSVLLFSPIASAQEDELSGRPSSGDMSLLSARTLGNGQTILAAGLGWPGLWVEALFSPSSTLNIGLKASVLYGSPIMGLSGGVGGSLSIPVRLHLFAKDSMDLALLIEPAAMVGEGALAGQVGTYSDNLGYAGYATAGMLGSAQISRAVTITAGLASDVAYVNVPDAELGSQIVVSFYGTLSLEALMSRDTMLFVQARGGYGLAPSDMFEGHEIARLSLGLAYLM